jgi:predicted DNA-binding ribbon-helix-helix protein
MNHPDAVPASLRKHFSQHNLTALLLAALSLVIAIVFWVILYAVSYWGTLLGLSVTRGVDTEAPAHFFPAFAVIALGLCLVAAFVRWLRPHEEVADRKPFWEVLLDVILIVPRVTFGVWGNLSAILFLSQREMAMAWELLQQIAAARQIDLRSIAVEIPNSRARNKIVTALQMADLVYLKKTDDGFFLAVRGEKAQELAGSRVKIEVAGHRQRGQGDE